MVGSPGPYQARAQKLPCGSFAELDTWSTSCGTSAPPSPPEAVLALDGGFFADHFASIPVTS